MKNYLDRLETEEDRKERKRAQCIHFHWAKICSDCGQVLDSEHIHNEQKVEEIPI